VTAIERRVACFTAQSIGLRPSGFAAGRSELDAPFVPRQMLNVRING